MQENFLIGIGGTGSRVLEAFVHCCAAGYGPKGKVHLLLIDPDKGNGNLTRTKGLIEDYRVLRANFKERESDNPAFQTNLVIPKDGKLEWTIFEEKDQTLAKFIGYENLRSQNGPMADVADLLFTRQELSTALNEGFRGHPSIGAVVMADPPMDEYPFKMLKDEMPQEANAARVFLVGSIFGGTGAAGFPTLGAPEVLKFNPALQAALGENRSKVLLGGALVLPYFSFKPDHTKGEKMFVTPQDFPVATKAALHYYNDKQLAFDQYYFVGDSLNEDVGAFSTGRAEQENSPHYIELASALAAFDFFSQDAPKENDPKSYFIASRQTARVTWDELPLTRYADDSDTHRGLAARRREFRDLITRFTTFCYTYLTIGRDHLNKPYNEQRLSTWFQDSFRNYEPEQPERNPSHRLNNELHKQATTYAQGFLRWITDLDAHDHVQLINREMLLVADAPAKDADGKPQLVLKNPAFHKESIGRLLRDQTEGLKYEDFVQRTLDIQSRIPDGAPHAAHKYLNIFFRAARHFTEANAASR